MQPKTTKTRFGKVWLVGALGLLLVLVAAALMVSFGQQSVHAQDVNGVTLQDVQTVDGFTVSAGNYRLANDRVSATVCHDKPDGEQWTIHKAVMEYDGKQPPEWSMELIEAASAGPTEAGRRCDVVSFPVEPGVMVHEFSITIEAVSAFPREGQDCDPEYIESFQRVLDERGVGITVDCERTPYIDGLIVAGKPDAMSMDEARSILSDDELFLSIRGRKGPWVFKGHFE